MQVTDMSDNGLPRKHSDLTNERKVRLGSAPTGQSRAVDRGLHHYTEQHLTATRQAVQDLKREFRATEKRLRMYGKEKSQPLSTDAIQGLDFLPLTDELNLNLGPLLHSGDTQNDDTFSASASQFSITHSDPNSNRATWIGREPAAVATSDAESVASARTFTLEESSAVDLNAGLSAASSTPTFKFVDAAIPAVPPTPAIARLMLADLTKDIRIAAPSWVTVQPVKGQQVATHADETNPPVTPVGSNSGPMISKSHSSLAVSNGLAGKSVRARSNPRIGPLDSKSESNIGRDQSENGDPGITATAFTHHRPALIRKSVRLVSKNLASSDQEPTKPAFDDEIVIPKPETVVFRKTMKFVDHYKEFAVDAMEVSENVVGQEEKCEVELIEERNESDVRNYEETPLPVISHEMCLAEEAIPEKPAVVRNKVVIDPQTILCGYPGFCDIRNINVQSIYPSHKPVTKQKSSKRKLTTKKITKVEQHSKKVPKAEHEYGDRTKHTITPTTWKEERKELRERLKALEKESKKRAQEQETKFEKGRSLGSIGTSLGMDKNVNEPDTDDKHLQETPSKVSHKEMLKVLHDNVLKIVNADSLKVSEKGTSVADKESCEEKLNSFRGEDDSNTKRDKSPPSKSRHYDVEETREFMEKQKQLRQKQIAEEKAKKKHSLELKKQKLQALREKQLQLVKANLEKCIYKKDDAPERREVYSGVSYASDVPKSNIDNQLLSRKSVAPPSISLELQLPGVALPLPQLHADADMDKKFKLMTEKLNIDLVKTQQFLSNPSQSSSANLAHSPPVKLDREPSASRSRSVSNMSATKCQEGKHGFHDKNFVNINGESSHSNIMTDVYSELQKMSAHTEKLQNWELTKQFEAINNDLLQPLFAKSVTAEQNNAKEHNNMNTKIDQPYKISTRQLIPQPTYTGRVNKKHSTVLIANQTNF